MNQNLFRHTFSLLNVDYVQLDRRWNYPHVISPYFRLYYIDAGEGQIRSDLGITTLKPGNLYLIPSYTLCSLKCSTQMNQYFIQFFEEAHGGLSLFNNHREVMELKAKTGEINLVKRMLEINPGRGLKHSENPKVYEKEAYYQEYRSLNRQMKPSVQFESQGIILMLLSRFVAAVSQKEKQPAIPSKIMESINHINLNIDKKLNIAELAIKANQNKDYFSRQFLEHTGQRPLSYIHEKRVERAQYLIVTTNKTLLDIALETGFNNLPHFSKIFKKKVNLTPGEYKRQSISVN